MSDLPASGQHLHYALLLVNTGVLISSIEFWGILCQNYQEPYG